MANLPHVTAGQFVDETDLNDIIDAINSNADTFASGKNRPMAILFATTAQSIPNATFTDLSFAQVDQDTNGGFDPASPTDYTVQVAGTYTFIGMCTFDPNSIGMRYLRFTVNDVAVAGRDARLTISGEPLELNIAHQMDLFVGDVVTLQARQDSGAALTTRVDVDVASLMKLHRND